MKTMTLRLDDGDAATLAMLARADEQSRAAVMRCALRRHAESRRTDPSFAERVQQLHADEAAAVGLTPATEPKELHRAQDLGQHRAKAAPYAPLYPGSLLPRRLLRGLF